MRTLNTMMLAFLFANVAMTASAQQIIILRAPTPPAPVAEVDAAPAHTPSVTIEIQGRIGGGSMWLSARDAGGIPAVESGQAGDMNFGATLSVRHYASGIGLTAGYTHAFTGVNTHYGTHGFDLRLSERATFVRQGNFSASVLVEAGAVYMTGGGVLGCPSTFFSIDDTWAGPCTPSDVSVGGLGGIGAVGIQFRYDALLAGLEVDYRHLVGSGMLTQQDDLMLMARVGVAFDL